MKNPTSENDVEEPHPLIIELIKILARQAAWRDHCAWLGQAKLRKRISTHPKKRIAKLG